MTRKQYIKRIIELVKELDYSELRELFAVLVNMNFSKQNARL